MAKAVRKGKYLIEYTGNRRTGKNAVALHRVLDRRGLKPNTLVTVNGDEGKRISVIDPRHCSKNAKHINHSCKPNCELISVALSLEHEVFMIRALRAIRSNTEATCPYAFQTESAKDSIKCNCGCEGCEGTV